jgi:succinoglycan biosynthesis transport protein ExoP
MASDLHFQELANILRRRKVLILAMAASGMALAGAGGLLIPARYTAKAQIIIEPQQIGRVGEAQTIINPGAEDFLIPTQVTTLLSREHMERVRNSLPEDPVFRAAQRAEINDRPAGIPWQKTVRDAWDGVVAWLPQWQPFAWLRALWWPDAGVETASEPLPAGVPGQEQFERRLKVFQEVGSHVIAVTYTAQNPGIAAAVANQIVQLYIEGQGEQKRAAASRELAWLEQRIPALKTEVERAEAAMGEYQAAHGFAAVNPSIANDQQIADLSRQLATAQADLAARQARLDYLRGLRQRGAGNGVFLATLDSPRLAELHREEVTLLQSAAELATGFGESHPKLQQIRNRLQDIRGKISQETDWALRNLENEVQIAAMPVGALRTRLAAIEGARADMHLRDFEHDVATKRQLYTSLVQRREEVRGQQDILRPDARILSRAAPPERPSSPNPLLFVFPAMVVFLVGGSMVAVLIERLDRRLRSQRDIGEALGIPCLALVPKLRRIGRTRPHLYLLAKPLAAYTEAIRSVVASLQLAAPSGASKVVLISSSVPEEGKTTLAVSLAAYMASLGRRVLLVDLDFRNSTILRELGGKSEGGVLDLLVHARPPAQVIQHLPELRLDYLPVSQRPVDPFALFASQQMSRLLGQLRDQYDCVIVDSPPLLAVTEARLLATMVDKVLFVVKWGSTRRDVAQNALSLLRGLSARGTGRDNLAGVVMTQVDLKKHASGRHGDSAESFVNYKKYYLED